MPGMEGFISFNGTLNGGIEGGSGGDVTDVKVRNSHESTFESVVNEEGVAEIDLVSYVRRNELNQAIQTVENDIDNIERLVDTKQNLLNYSTEEQNTGQKWIDDKDIYCCVIDNINDNNWHSIANLNISELLPTTTGYFITNNQYYIFNLYAESQYASYMQYDYTNKAILLKVIGWTTSKRVAILFYTKN